MAEDGMRLGNKIDEAMLVVAGGAAIGILVGCGIVSVAAVLCIISGSC
jgi:hypothetical protein